MTQMSDGTWTAYVVDHETALNLQGRNGGESAQADSAFEYGIMCDAGLGAQKVGGTDGPRAGFGGNADNDVTTNPSYYQGFSTGDGGFANHYCQDTVDTSDQDTGGQVKFSVL